MAYYEAQSSVDEAVHDFVADLTDNVVDALMEAATSVDDFYINHSDMLDELDVDGIFDDIISENEDAIDRVVSETFYDLTIYTDDCIDIIKEYGIDDAVNDYYKDMELRRCNDVAYHILNDNVTKGDINVSDYYDSIYMSFAERWNKYTSMYCIQSLERLVEVTSREGFSKLVYEDDSIRFYNSTTSEEFKVTKDFCLMAGTMKLQLEFIRDNVYDSTLEFYCNGVKIATQEC